MFVYILANKTHVVLYTGVTRDLERRLWEHKMHADPRSFTARYHVDQLVYFEEYKSPSDAIAREKQIKSWSRSRKNELVESKNPRWEDIYLKLQCQNSEKSKTAPGETDSHASVRTGSE